MRSRSLSVVIPALNEEGNIKSVCDDVSRLADRCLSEYEILVFDDASTDRTAEIVRQLQRENPRLLLFQNPINRGIGYNFRAGALKARYDSILMVPGDNEIIADSLGPMLRELGTCDLLVGYASNPEIRPLFRRWVSRLFTSLINLLFGLKLHYYNGPAVIPVNLAIEFAPISGSFAYMASILVQALKKRGRDYKEFAFRLQERRYGKTKAFRLRNVIRVISDLVVLVRKVYFGSPVA